jgi:methylthioribose-1-phosphate isomerase
VDEDLSSGAAIPIELRGDDEVLAWSARRVAPPGARAHNPAFDVTPASLVSALITEHGPRLSAVFPA